MTTEVAVEFSTKRRRGSESARRTTSSPVGLSLQGMPFGILLADSSGRAQQVNDCWQEHFDQRDDSWRGAGWQRALEGEALEELLADIRFGREHRTDVDNGRRTFDLWAVPRSDADSTYWVITAVDVTDERRRTAALRERATHDEMTGLCNRAQFLEFLAHALDKRGRDPEGVTAVLFIDVDHLKTTNDVHGHDAGDRLLREVAERISAAVRPADVVARYGGDEFAVLCEDLLAPTEAHAIADRVVDAVNQGQTDVAGTVSVGVAIATDPDSEPLAIVGAADHDMYRARAGDPSRGADGAKERRRPVPDRSTATRSGVLAATAHELRTPLTSIIGYAQTLRAETPNMQPEAIDRALGAIERQGLRLARILDELLDIGRIRNGEASSLQTVDVSKVVRDALEAAPPPDGVTVVDRVTGGERYRVSAAGENDLSRLVTNLLTNAYRHGGSSIALTARMEGGHVELVLTDDGPGIPDDLVLTIFQPFVRGNRVDAEGRRGSGLGLSLASAIAAASGGTLTYASVLPHGARFVLRLPIATAQE
jgi:diguanylate cyclase (GGDEF)-like protein